MAASDPHREAFPLLVIEGPKQSMSSSTERLWANIDDYMDENPTQPSQVEEHSMAPAANTPPSTTTINYFVPPTTTIAEQEVGLDDGPPNQEAVQNQSPPTFNEPRVGYLEEKKQKGKLLGKILPPKMKFKLCKSQGKGD